MLKTIRFIDDITMKNDDGRAISNTERLRSISEAWQLIIIAVSDEILRFT